MTITDLFPLHGAHLLVVDDDADLLRLLAMRLTASGYRVTTADSAEAALARLAVERPDLVISDVRLPDRDGLALFHEIRTQHAALPVILLICAVVLVLALGIFFLHRRKKEYAEPEREAGEIEKSLSLEREREPETEQEPEFTDSYENRKHSLLVH